MPATVLAAAISLALSACNTSGPSRTAVTQVILDTPHDVSIRSPADALAPAGAGDDRVDDAETAVRKAILDRFPWFRGPMFAGARLTSAAPLPLPKNTECYPYEAFCVLEPMNPPPGLRDADFDGCYSSVYYVGHMDTDGPMWLWELSSLDALNEHRGNEVFLRQELTRKKRVENPRACCYLLASCK